ncbi:ECF transporter S component [Terrisporobacter mayombei]|uniref:Riboflavin transporter n=1 Tax=Terrisporobacter mayombei TaxID=1541 RepID=A0ABY9Q323_9FIRM|nr:ECF transporter S component [Terrisporobacter mayombei]MCC3870147.1 ECF transporter S component [Terrisporobacter mayombei]WMT82385.1 Riboflavin transporter RibU [Terrisporobacter mayombei]
MQNAVRKPRVSSAKTIAKVGVLSAIAYILMFISVPLPIFPSFLKIDLSDIPAIFGGMSLGPMAGLAIVIVKNLLQGITASTTGGVGEFANVVIGGSYVLIICLFYKKLKTTKGVLAGGLVGIIAMTIMGCIMNYFIMIPLYVTVYGMPLEQIIQMGTIINPRVTDLMTFVIWMIAPFNILKAGIMTVVTLPLFKKMEKILSK